MVLSWFAFIVLVCVSVFCLLQQGRVEKTLQGGARNAGWKMAAHPGTCAECRLLQS